MAIQRRQEFRKNENLERLLQEINSALGPVEETILRSYEMPKLPVVLIVGCGRSGSTLMQQWLANTGQFAYPTNLLSRFYDAPYIGAKIQQLLTDPVYDFNREFFDIKGAVSFQSDLGKTRGALGPNEFWYFWRRFFPSGETEFLDENLLREVEADRFAAELAAIESVFQKPFAMKAHSLRFNIPFLSSILKKVLIIFVRRHPLYNIQSLLESREKYSGDRRAWFGAKPREFDSLKDLTPIEQVAGQVFFTSRAIREGIDQIETSRGLQVDYEEFCASPGSVFNKIMDKLADQGYEVGRDYAGPTEFGLGNIVRLPESERELVVHAYRAFSGVELAW